MNGEALNHFALSAALGSSIGPSVSVAPGQIASSQTASTISNLQNRRRGLWQDDEHHVQSKSDEYFRLVKAAYLGVRDGLSVERVIVDQQLNKKYVEACRRVYGIEDSVFHLNLALMALRKKGGLKGIHSRRLPTISEPWLYSHACEIAAQTVYFRYQASVDTLVCHPKLAAEFDSIARTIAPGFSSFDYRWTALNIRKKGTDFKAVDSWETDVDWSSEIPFDAIEKVPEDEGLYLLKEGANPLLVSQSDNLHDSIADGQNILSIGSLASDLWTPNPDRLHWQYAETIDASSEYRYGFVRALVAKYHPVFNVPRGLRSAA